MITFYDSVSNVLPRVVDSFMYVEQWREIFLPLPSVNLRRDAALTSRDSMTSRTEQSLRSCVKYGDAVRVEPTCRFSPNFSLTRFQSFHISQLLSHD